MCIRDRRSGESYAAAQTYYIASRYRGYDYGAETYGSEKYNAAMLPYGGILYNMNDDMTGWNIQNKLTFQKTLGEYHRINVLLGTEVTSQLTKNRSYKTFGYSEDRGESVTQPTPVNELVSIGYNPLRDWGILNELYTGAGWGRTTNTNNQFSLFATLVYSLMDRYVLNVSAVSYTHLSFSQSKTNKS